MAAAARAPRDELLKLVGIAKSASQRGRVDTVSKIFKEQRDALIARPSLYEKMRNYYVNAHVADAAHNRRDLESLCETLEGKGFKMDMRQYTSVIAALAREGQMQPQVKYVWDLMLKKGYKPDTIAYNALLMAFNPDVVEVEEVLHAMKTAGCKPNESTVHLLLDMYGRVGNFTKALEYVRVLEGEGKQLTMYAFSILMREASRRGNVDVCRDIYAELCHRNLPISDEIISFLLKSYIRSEDLIGAETAFHSLRGRHPEAMTSHTWNTMIEAYCKLHSLEAGIACFGDMSRSNTTPSIGTYEVLLEGYVKEDRLDLAADVLEVVDKDGKKPSIRMYDLLARAQARQGNYEVVSHIRELVKMNNGRLEYTTYAVLIEEFGKHRGLEAAEELYNDMKDHCKLTQRACLLMMQMYSSMNLRTRALGIVNDMVSAGVEPNAEIKEIFHQQFLANDNELLSSPQLRNKVFGISARIDALQRRRQMRTRLG
eukprot:CAMPEP_0198729128 /NCGR_PEP_ID=MMETSP1475-20131203/14892_1 /TAXON_ID= ORGANISM="Unidentified sp., Strain CCMP1999" /NCGR_SAMPLE_ID=MMETSP1475 /ASSEMBLY_ACC=CAM_ASM_001111 /LENGTH=484 /DNA_ID=CAMNT_0044491697 /DNA_START=46 /DNA_END=1497 /DNA_ORIENTATION=-